MSNAIPVRRSATSLPLPRVTTGGGRAVLRLARCYLRVVGGTTLLVGVATLLTGSPVGGWLLGLVYLAMAPASTLLLPQLWVEHNPAVGIALLLVVALLNAAVMAAAALLLDLLLRRRAQAR